MKKYHLLILIAFAVLLPAVAAMAEGPILVVKFDCQPPLRYLTSPLADSLTANLKILQIPTVSRSKWESSLAGSGYRENDLNYNPPVLTRLIEKLHADGAVYGQVYTKDGLIIMDAFYLEAGSMIPVDIEPMIGNSGDDILEMTWDLAVIISHPDKKKPYVVKVEPADSADIKDDYIEMKVYFDEPMNPDSYGITGEPSDMFFTYGEVQYLPEEFCFKFNVHLYPGKDYKFWVNGPGIKPFMDDAGNVARTYQWRISTK
jgi:hypothetical protein